MKKLVVFLAILNIFFSATIIIAAEKPAAKPLAKTSIRVLPPPTHYFLTLGEYKKGCALWEVFESGIYTTSPTTWDGEKWIVSGKTGGFVTILDDGSLVWHPSLKGKVTMLKPFKSKNGLAWGFVRE